MLEDGWEKDEVTKSKKYILCRLQSYIVQETVTP
jgi:hypothetical protein